MKSRLKYNICFIKQGDRILLLNREKPSWMGCWNGVGGKLEPEESPTQSMIREISEEVNLTAADYELSYKGIVTWTVDGQDLGGMYLYAAELPTQFPYFTPIKTTEGILDWKQIDWILNPRNQGVASNIPVFLNALIYDPACYEHHCVYSDGRLIRHNSTPIELVAEQVEAFKH
ncbi:8-oxo-dGTP diphosphatase [Paenibacillus sp. FSL H7-0331]|jgi:8-oxo-dGTP diphosphatase|uniref:NUDIX hydrolase n=1 Tax=Paenibacillus sp. FSL H7-0331 TaxID=1920421 RepID=UPI00096F322E|nr:8-oxo-dGTP diphosphatase [Paenibacillus sp. FSL H7-0331]OMF15784.1 DNA mismatch repair protein MutT [Paenibacillus sp. FSL H7-0331]